ncbi:MAG: pentapeptide repeat-containing protein [Paracoccaceae bacterium]|nr:pentapeptide repeat-containing protein [Paracoccaceae bacterium]
MTESAMGMAMLIAATAVHAQDGDRSEDMRTLGDCGGCNFTVADFSGRKLTGINLMESRLSTVDFREAMLSIAMYRDLR